MGSAKLATLLVYHLVKCIVEARLEQFVGLPEVVQPAAAHGHLARANSVVSFLSMRLAHSSFPKNSSSSFPSQTQTQQTRTEKAGTLGS